MQQLGARPTPLTNSAGRWQVRSGCPRRKEEGVLPSPELAEGKVHSVCTGGASEQLMPKAGKMQSTPPAPTPTSGPTQENPGAAKHRVQRKEIRIVGRSRQLFP